MKSLEALLAQGLAAGVFPSAEAVVFHRGKQVFSGSVGAVVEGSEYDLASLTKVLATTTSFVVLWAEGKVSPETPLAQFFPDSPASKAGATLEDLLTHRSGLPAWRPLYETTLTRAPELLAATVSEPARKRARKDVVRAAALVELERPPRERAVYSDVGFILLGEALAQAAGQPLDELVSTHVSAMLGVGLHYHRLSAISAPHLARSLPTGEGRPREPAPGQPPLDVKLGRGVSRAGEVDDDNAWAMDGVAGHAGLFGRAGDVAQVGQAVLDELGGLGLLAPRELWERLLTRDVTVPESTRALGFDTPSAQDSSAGAHLGGTAPGAFGHLGFTGTSLWVDRPRSLVVALCTNRTALGRTNTAIRAFRPRFHDAIVQALGLT